MQSKASSRQNLTVPCLQGLLHSATLGSWMQHLHLHLDRSHVRLTDSLCCTGVHNTPLFFSTATEYLNTMGFLDNKFIAKFINGGAPPAAYTQQIRDRAPPDYEEYATQRRIENERLEKMQIYMNLPTQNEREQLEKEEKERRE